VASLTIKAGATFAQQFSLVEDDGVTPVAASAIRGQIRDRQDMLVWEMAFTQVGTGQYTVTHDTSGWPVGNLRFDLLLTLPSGAVNTETVDLVVQGPVTR
jgi:hypothetical protein